MLCMYWNYIIIYFSGCIAALFIVVPLTRVRSINNIHIILSSVAAVLLSWLTPIMALLFYIVHKNYK